MQEIEFRFLMKFQWIAHPIIGAYLPPPSFHSAGSAPLTRVGTLPTALLEESLPRLAW